MPSFRKPPRPKSTARPGGTTVDQLVEAAREAAMRLATEEAARMQRAAIRPGVDPIDRERILAEADALTRHAAHWVETLSATSPTDACAIDIHDPTAILADVGTQAMPAPSWALGHDGDGCVVLQHALHAPARTAEQMLNHLLGGPLDEEKARDRLAWAAAVIIGQRELPESEMVRATIRALEDAMLARVTQDAAGIVTWARKEAPAAFGRMIDMARFSSSMKSKSDANQFIMGLAGITPTQKMEHLHRHEIIDLMTREEQERYATTGDWPARLLTIDTTAKPGP